MEGYPVAACVANHRREIMVAIMGCIGEERLLGRVIDKRGALGKTVEATLVLGAHEASRARLLHHLPDALKKGRAQRIGADAVEPHAVELIAGHKLFDPRKFLFHEIVLGKGKRRFPRVIFSLCGGGLIGLGSRSGRGPLDNQPFWMPLGKLRIKGRHVVSQDLDLPLAQGRHLRSQNVKGQSGMHRPQGTWIVAITIHILGKHRGAVNVCFKQPVPKLVGVESLTDLRNVPRVVELDVNLPPRPRPPGGDPRIDPELLGNST